MTQDAPELDSSQRAVVELPPDARVLVIAGAGQGKTEVVAARLQHLTEVEALAPFDEILVLSFSRAAVFAVRHRLRGRGAAARVAVRTFDSFASRLLLEAGEGATGGYEARIRRATQLVQDDKVEIPTLDMLRHVIVDEVQDLVGDRAAFVARLLARLDTAAGFTALGDPLQAIYDFQLGDARAQGANAELLRTLNDQLGATEKELNTQYRAQSEEARGVVGLATAMRRPATPSRRLDLAVAFTRELPSVGDENDLTRVLPRWKGRTAVLCRTNGQVMVVSNALADAGVSHRVRRPAEELAIPGWVARALSRSPSRTLPRDVVEDTVGKTPGAPDPESAWRMLKSAERRRAARDLDLVALSARIAAGDVPVDLADDGAADIVVSTVHRAKGLEFDNVALVEGQETGTDDYADERAREIFVGLSRSRERLATFRLADERWIYREQDPPQRWIRTGPRGGWMTTGFEVKTTDVETRRPASTDAADAPSIQDALAFGFKAGVRATALLDPRSRDKPIPVYRLHVDKEVVGVTSDSFGGALSTRLNRAWPNHPGWPAELQGLVVDGVMTVAGPAHVGSDAGVGRWGLWLAIRVGGLGRLVFQKERTR